MSTFYTLLTRVGAALHANAQVQQTTVPWTHLRLGDGNGAPVTPTENQTSLVRQVHVLPITDIAVHPENPNWVIAEAVVPSDVGGWTVRETAIYGGADGNTCIAVGNYPETYKPVLAEGAGREMVMRMVVEISSVATVKLQIDPAVAIASRGWVESLVATPFKAGLVKLASVAEHLPGSIDNKAATPEGVAAMINPLCEKVNESAIIEYSGTATLTGTDNKIVMADVEARLGLNKGDVIQIEGAGAQNAKLRTIESLHASGNEVQVNYEHCGSRGNGSLKLEDFTGPVTIKRIAKWHSASEGLGQDWVVLTSFRTYGVPYANSTNRVIEAEIRAGGADAGVQFFVGAVMVGSQDLSVGVGGGVTSGGAVTIDSEYRAIADGGTFHGWAERR